MSPHDYLGKGEKQKGERRGLAGNKTQCRFYTQRQISGQWSNESETQEGSHGIKQENSTKNEETPSQLEGIRQLEAFEDLNKGRHSNLL